MADQRSHSDFDRDQARHLLNEWLAEFRGGRDAWQAPLAATAFALLAIEARLDSLDGITTTAGARILARELLDDALRPLDDDG